MNSEQRQKMIEEELNELVKNDLISQQVYQHVMMAYKKHHQISKQSVEQKTQQQVIQNLSNHKKNLKRLKLMS
ncbi:hypothetical protein [Amphibacillus indicireducens]|uniref:Uncharacterized protein n=1 Tax=Amphibacillus indicireducens TaxID=1076330 RepID=A0ABP7VPI8_9BACI